jgi:integrase
MGTLVKRGDSARAVVRLRGQTKTKTFARTKDGIAAARRWMIEQEAHIVQTVRAVTGATIAKALEQMRLEELKKPYRTQTAAAFATHAKEFGDVDLSKLTAEWWVEKAMAWKVTPASRNTKLLRIFGALKRAQILFGYTVNWDAIKLAKGRMYERKQLGKSRARDRRVSEAEVKAIKAQIGRATATEMPLADMIDFALLTGFRRAEIVRVTWDDLNTIKGGAMLWVRDRKDPRNKIGNDDNVPLLGAAAAIVKRQPRLRLEDGGLDPRIFPYNAEMMARNFRQCSRAAQLKNIHFHDLRHEAISRLFEQGYGIPEVCLVSGHKSWTCLKIYTNLAGADLHNGPLAKRAA